MLISAGLQYVFTSKSSFDLCRRRRPLSLLAPAGFKHNFPDMGGLYGAVYNVWCNRQISHASRAIPIPTARSIVRSSRRERGNAIVIKVAATPRGPHAGGCKPHIKACLNTCSTACRSRYFSRPQNAFILAYSGILDIPPAVFFTGGKSQRQVLLLRVVCRDRACRDLALVVAGIQVKGIISVSIFAPLHELIREDQIRAILELRALDKARFLATCRAVSTAIIALHSIVPAAPIGHRGDVGDARFGVKGGVRLDVDRLVGRAVDGDVRDAGNVVCFSPACTCWQHRDPCSCLFPYRR